MNKLLSLLTIMVISLFALNSFAWTPPASPAPTSWISDTSNVLSNEAHARLDAKLKVINQGSANELAALIVPTLDGESITDVADLTFKSWGVGKKGLDNGVLIVLAMKEHKTHITTGKGVEGDLPDLKCNDILQSLRPSLRNGNVEGALGIAFDSSARAIANHKAEAAAGKRQPSCQASGVGVPNGAITTLIVVAGFSLLLWYLNYSTRRRRQQEEALAEIRRETARLSRQRAEEERKKLEANRLLQKSFVKPLSIPISITTPVHNPPPVTRAKVEPVVHHPVATAVVAAGAAIAAAEADALRHRRDAERQAEHRREEDARKRRERDEEDRRRRDREDEDRRSSSSSSSSFDWGSSSSGGGSDSGGFGGGDSGGGGSSGDW